MNFFQKLFSGGTTAEKPAIVPGALLVDVRTPGEFADGHVPGSVNIPLNQLPMQTGKLKNKPQIVVFCRSGNRSAQAAAFLKQNGVANVIDGGTWTRVKGWLTAPADN